MTDLNLCNSKN